MNKENNMHVWRYMSFAKFVWTIQNKCLWLSRADLLGDPWEISLSGEQLQLVIDRHPITPISVKPKETAEERSKRIIALISLFEKLRFYFFDVALTPGLIQKVIANVFSSARIKKIFV